MKCCCDDSQCMNCIDNKNTPFGANTLENKYIKNENEYIKKLNKRIRELNKNIK